MPYDIGQIGQLDLHILTGIYGGDDAARDLTPAWDGGLYWAGQLRSATTPAQQASTASLVLFYLSAWKTKPSAQAFAQLYADNLGRKYSGLKPVAATPTATQNLSAQIDTGDQEQIFTTTEGPVLITTRGKLVFVAESFPLDLARKLTALILDAQGTGELKMASASPTQPLGAPGTASGTWDGTILNPPVGPSLMPPATQPLTASLIRFLSNCGVMKAAVDAGIEAAAR
jgi:hypothetical protein